MTDESVWLVDPKGVVVFRLTHTPSTHRLNPWVPGGGKGIHGTTGNYTLLPPTPFLKKRTHAHQASHPPLNCQLLGDICRGRVGNPITPLFSIFLLFFWDRKRWERTILQWSILNSIRFCCFLKVMIINVALAAVCSPWIGLLWCSPSTNWLFFFNYEL